MKRMLVAAAAALFVSAVGAAEWPAKPVRIIVPFAAGGAADTLGRLYADAFGAAFAKQFYVENRAGGGSVIGTEAAARSDPDGHTLMVSGLATHVLAFAMNRNAGFDPMRDFTHIAYFGGAPNALVVHPALGVASFKELLARARSQTDGTQYVSAGLGAVGNLVAEYLAAKESITLVHVAYRGGSNAILDLLAGHVKVGMMTWSTVGEHVRAGRLIALAVSSADRVPYVPDVPTLKELGYPELVATTWFSLSGPAGLPPEVTDKINRAAVRSLERPQVRKQIEQDAVEAKAMTPAEVTHYMQSELDRWVPLIKRVLTSKNP